MNTKLLFKNAYRCLMHHKGRSLLTLLGIIIGIAAIIATLAIGYGVEEKIKKQIMTFGDNFIMVWAGNFAQEGVTQSKRRKRPKRMTLEDIKAFKNQCPEIKQASPFLSFREIVMYQGTNLLCQIKGGDENFLDVAGRKIERGDFFTSHHVQKKSRVIVLGNKTAKDLFKTIDPVGQIVQIKGLEFKVIGIIEKIGKALGSQDPNFDSFIPYTTSKKYIHGVINNEIHGICISAKSVDQTQGLAKQIRKILRSRHNLEPEEPNDFMCIDQKGMMEAAESSAGTLNIFLLIIASISLLVGGIGVMNIMLVSVTERRKEIGIRMALGAPNRVILKQFLIESVVLCFVGGVIGIILGMIAPYITHYVADFPVVLKLHPVVISVFTIFLIGIVFGYYPAWKASRLNPVEALLEE
jgi:putative ABC transport system permease protein